MTKSEQPTDKLGELLDEFEDMIELTEKYHSPMPVDEVTYAYPCDVINTGYLPPYEQIPERFHDSQNEYAAAASMWFYNFGDVLLLFDSDVDVQMAGRHLEVCLRSYQPKHEHKIAGVAYLMHRWKARLQPREAPESSENAPDQK